MELHDNIDELLVNKFHLYSPTSEVINDRDLIKKAKQEIKEQRIVRIKSIKDVDADKLVFPFVTSKQLTSKKYATLSEYISDCILSSLETEVGIQFLELIQPNYIQILTKRDLFPTLADEEYHILYYLSSIDNYPDESQYYTSVLEEELKAWKLMGKSLDKLRAKNKDFHIFCYIVKDY